MKSAKNFRWLLAILILIVTTAMLRITYQNVVYLPVVMVDATLTPSPTPTPTPTPKPSGVMIEDIFQSNTVDPLDEYVSIHNYTSSSVSLTGWFIRDDGTNRYNFPDGFSISSKQTIRLWTKAGSNTTTDLFWGSQEEVWNDERDCAYLRDDSDGDNELIDIYCYQKTSAGTIIIIRNHEE